MGDNLLCADYYASWPTDYIKAVIWDWDGTSVDTLPHVFQFWKYVCDRCAKPFPLKDHDHVRREMRDPFPRFYTEVLKIDFEENDCWIKPAFEEYMARAKVRLRPGVKETWDYCASLGLKNGIASDNLESVIYHRLNRLNIACGVDGLIKSVVGHQGEIKKDGIKNDARKKKPYPDTLIECARQLGVSPAACLYVGDVPADILASRAAGMRSAVITGGYSTIDKLADANPTFLVDSADELRPFIRRLIPIAQVHSAVWDP